jgi:Bacterial TSP3 repeat
LTSPCIDAGTPPSAPLADKDGTPRPLDGKNSGIAAFDIGAFEYVNPGADTDHDGLPDAAELIAGTDPTNPKSVLNLQADLLSSGNAIVLSWPSVTNRTYRIAFRPALESGNWDTPTNVPATGAWIQILDSFKTGGTRFYRLGASKN